VGEMFNSNCISCNNDCDVCQGFVNNCQKCRHLNAVLNQNDGTCSCPEGFSLNELQGRCMRCPEGCSECTYENDLVECTSCH
jgi:hypothetical protein